MRILSYCSPTEYLWYVLKKVTIITVSNSESFCFQGPFKRMQHFETTSSNIVGHNMLSSFEHHVGTCWAMLDRVGRCWMKFDFYQTFRPTSTNIFLRECAYENIHWYSVYPRTSKRMSSNNVIKKIFSFLLLIHALVLSLFRLGSSSSSINSIKTAVATNFRFFHNWETAMFLFCKQIKKDCAILGCLVPRPKRSHTNTWVLLTI